MKRKTSELTGAALDWAVAKAAGRFEKQIRDDAHPMTGITDIGFDEHGALAVYVPGPRRDASGLKREPYEPWHPSTNWAQGGQIIEEERMELRRIVHIFQGQRLHWIEASIQPIHKFENYTSTMGPSIEARGHTHLLAAMRCYVTWKLGPEVDIPDELC